MWIIQICIASFWWYVGINLAYREAIVWETVGEIRWFRQTFGSSSSRKWERFCREAGLISLVASCLRFVSLPFGIGIFGIGFALPPLLFLL